MTVWKKQGEINYAETLQIFALVRRSGDLGGPDRPELYRLDVRRPGHSLQPVPRASQIGQGHRDRHLRQSDPGEDEGRRRPRRIQAFQNDPCGSGPLQGAGAVSRHLQGRDRIDLSSRPLLLDLSAAAVRRRLVFPHEEDGRPAGRLHDPGQEQGEDLHGKRAQRHLRGRGGGGRGEAGAGRGDRIPENAGKIHQHRGQDPQGDSPRGSAGNRQDPPGQGRRRRKRRPLLQPLRIGIRRDVRRPRGGPRPGPLRPGQGEGPLHHLHRRARRPGKGPRFQRHGRTRRTRTDA